MDGRFDMSRLIVSFAYVPRSLVKMTEFKAENKMSDAKLHFKFSNPFKFR
jgi:hypothetical protein